MIFQGEFVNWYMKNFTLILCLAALHTASCKKSAKRGDHFIFGSFHSECAGNCASYYMLKDGKVYPDDMSFERDKLKFKNKSLSQDKFDLAKKLEEEVPAFIINTKESTFGCPDCRDQGGYFLQIKRGANTQTIRIDTDLAEVPNEMRPFVIEMSKVLEEM